MKKLIIQILLSSIVILIIFLLFNFEEYFANTLLLLQSNKAEYALFSFVLLVSDILLPVPSSIVMYTNGLVLGTLSGFLLSLISALIGSVLGYAIGRFAANKMGFMISEDAQRLLTQYGFLAIFLTRGIPILAESVSLLCGYNKVEFRYFTLLNIVGYIPVCFVYAYFGNIGNDGNYFLLSFGLALALSGIFWFTGRYFLKTPTNGVDQRVKF